MWTSFLMFCHWRGTVPVLRDQLILTKDCFANSNSNWTMFGLDQIVCPAFQGRLLSICPRSIVTSRTHHVYGQVEEDHFLYHVITSGRHLLSFWGPIKTDDSRGNVEYLIDVYDRQKVDKGRYPTETIRKSFLYFSEALGG